jgi:hypothetical protein
MCMGSLACAQTLIKLVCFPYIFCLLHLCNQNLTLSFNNNYFLIDKFQAPTQNFTLTHSYGKVRFESELIDII